MKKLLLIVLILFVSTNCFAVWLPHKLFIKNGLFYKGGSLIINKKSVECMTYGLTGTMIIGGSYMFLKSCSFEQAGIGASTAILGIHFSIKY